MKTEEIKKKVREWDTKECIKELNEKSSLKLYREWKKDIGGQERVYDNSESAMILFKYRSNNMNLSDKKKFQNESTICISCAIMNMKIWSTLSCTVLLTLRREERTKPFNNPILKRSPSPGEPALYQSNTRF